MTLAKRLLLGSLVLVFLLVAAIVALALQSGWRKALAIGVGAVAVAFAFYAVVVWTFDWSPHQLVVQLLQLVDLTVRQLHHVLDTFARVDEPQAIIRQPERAAHRQLLFRALAHRPFVRQSC